MRIKQTPIVYSQDRATNQNNINTSNSFGQLAKNPQLSANNLTGIVLTAGNNTIPHKLNRKISGWSLIGKNAAADVFQFTGSQPELFLYLTSSADVTVDLSVF